MKSFYEHGWLSRAAASMRPLVFAFAISFLSGCSMIGKHVNAYERSNLSKQGMLLVENPQEQSEINHMYNSREGSVGGMGGAGGGCGCN